MNYIAFVIACTLPLLAFDCSTPVAPDEDDDDDNDPLSPMLHRSVSSDDIEEDKLQVFLENFLL